MAKNSDNHKNQFSPEGADAVQAYYENLSEDIGENIEFDPIAWCVEWTEFNSLVEAYREHYGDDTDLPEEQRRTQNDQIREFFEDNTTLIELENGNVLLSEF